MKIVSTVLPAAFEELTGNWSTVVMAFDTLVDKKSLVVGITVGPVDGPNVSDIRWSPVGQAVLQRASTHHLLNYPDGPVVLAGVASVSGAKERVRKVLTDAPPNALVLLLCANNKVYDSAFPALGLDAKSANMNLQ